MPKTETEKQREIGRQIFMVNILHTENDNARKRIPPCVTRVDLAAWAEMSAEELDRFIEACRVLDPRNRATAAARICSMEEPFRSKSWGHQFAAASFFETGPLLLSSLNEGPFQRWCEILAAYNYMDYHREYPDNPVGSQFVSPEVFGKMMKVYIRHFLKTAQEVLSDGYEWDVVAHMAGTNMTEETYKRIVELFGTD